ncbi:MAG: chorismate-binding protein [Cytophagales bacterium]
MLSVATKTVTSVSIKNVFQTLLDAHYSIGIYKMPAENTIFLVADEFPTRIETENIDLQQVQGFLVAPFEKHELYPIFVIKPSFTAHFTIKENGEIVANTDFDEDFLETLQTYAAEVESSKPKSVEAKQDESFQDSVSEALKTIEKGSVKKVVLSRKKEVPLPSRFNAIDFFIKLCREYTNSFVSITSCSLSGTWIGASPELLVSLDEKNIFRTVALAGTKPVNTENLTSNTNWTEKEIEEQALVSRYIIDCFKKIRLREYEEIGPKTVQAGNLLHLKTQFSVNTDEVNYENLASTMLHLLHPTSAVCGMPKNEALQVIHQLEKTPREYYAGFLGPVNINFDFKNTLTSLFVNLRCMKVDGQAATLFAGAGITLDSVPENEYLETENKFLTLLSKF